MRTLLAALAAAVLLAACASTPPDATGQDGAQEATPDDAGGPAEDTGGDPSGGPELAVEPTPDAGPGPDADGPGSDLAFTAATVDGGQLDASSLEGRDVVLWFWAPW